METLKQTIEFHAKSIALSCTAIEQAAQKLFNQHGDGSANNTPAPTEIEQLSSQLRIIDSIGKQTRNILTLIGLVQDDG